MKLRVLADNLSKILGLAVCWALYFLSALKLGFAADADSAAKLFLIASKILGGVFIIQTVLLLTEKNWIFGLISGGLGICLFIFGSLVALGILVFIMPVVTIILTVSSFYYVKIVKDTICRVFGYIFAISLIAGSVTGIFVSISNGRNYSIIGSLTTQKLIWPTLILIASGLVCWIIWTIRASKFFLWKSAQSADGSGSSSGSRNTVRSKSGGKPATEKEIKRELDYVASECTGLKEFGSGASAHYEVVARLFGGDIEFTVRLTLSSGYATDSYTVNKIKDMLKTETEKVCENVMNKTKSRLSNMNLPRSYNINVKLVK